MHSLRAPLLSAALLALCAGTTVAQQPAPPVGPQVGDVAPDFTIIASDQAGVRAKPFHLADARGSTVVLAFFSRARTKG